MKASTTSTATTTNQLPKSQLYNIEKLISRSNQIRNRTSNTLPSNRGSLGVGERIFEWGASLERRLKEEESRPRRSKIDSKRASFAKKTVSIDSIKLTERFLNVCRAVDYIANIMKAKAQLDEVFILSKSISFVQI